MTLKRLEQQKLHNAPLWLYRNCAIALGVKLERILDAREKGWRPRPAAPQPPPTGWLQGRARLGDAGRRGSAASGSAPSQARAGGGGGGGSAARAKHDRIR